jgi:hypothetical protein
MKLDGAILALYTAGGIRSLALLFLPSTPNLPVSSQHAEDNDRY